MVIDKIVIIMMLLAMNIVFAENIMLTNKLESVNITDNDSNFGVDIKFSNNNKVRVSNPLLGGNYIQYNINNSIIEPDKKFYDGSHVMIDKVMLYQYDPKTVRVRIFFSSNVLNRKIFDSMVVGYPEPTLITLKHITKNLPDETKKDLAEASVSEENNIENAASNTNDDVNTDIVTAIENKAKEVKNSKELSKVKEEIKTIDNSNKKDDRLQLKKSSTGTGLIFSKMLYSLGIVLLLVFAVSWLVRKFMKQSGVQAQNNKLMKVMVKEYIAPKRYLAIVRILNKYILIGVTNDNISMLSELDNINDETFKEKVIRREVFQTKNFPSLKDFIFKKKPKERKSFDKTLNDISDNISPLVSNDKPKEDTVSFDALRKLGERILEKRKNGDKDAHSKSEDPVISNLANMIKEKVREMPEV